MTAPIPMRWTGEAMEPLPNFARQADRDFVIGQVYRLAEVEERSEVSHNHEFAWLENAWQSLPDDLKVEYPSKEALRKRALIRTGHCTIRDHVCGSKAEAQRWAAYLSQELDEYSIIEQRECVVRVYRAKSQKRTAMGRAEFQQSKTDILEWVSSLLGVDPATLQRQREAA